MEPVLERADSEWWWTDSQTAEFWLISGNQKHEKMLVKIPADRESWWQPPTADGARKLINNEK